MYHENVSAFSFVQPCLDQSLAIVCRIHLIPDNRLTYKNSIIETMDNFQLFFSSIMSKSIRTAAEILPSTYVFLSPKRGLESSASLKGP
jgi:thymidine phosphorylase